MKICGKEFRIEGRLLRVARPDADKYDSIENPVEIVRELRESGARVDLFTFMQLLPDTLPKYDYPMEWDNLAVLPVTSFEHWWDQVLGFKARNKARQAEKKGIVVREVPFNDELVKGIWEIYNECPVRQGRRFRHYGKDLATVRREECTFPENSVFAGAFLGDRMVGFTKLVYNESRSQAGLMNIVSMIQHRDKAPTNGLIAQAVRSCADRKIPHLVYSSFTYANKEHSSITDFKERNGFRRVNLPRYYVPLTRAGEIAFRLGLHRRLADHVPHALAAKLRDVRSAWYNRRLKMTMETR